MPAPRRNRSSSRRRETYAEVLNALVKSEGEKVKEFAARIGVERPTVSNAKGARGPTKPLHDLLVKKFPRWEARLEAAWEARPHQPAQQQTSSLQKRIKNLADPHHALRAVGEGLRAATSSSERHWLYESLATIHLGQHQGEAAVQALNNALSCAVAAGLVTEELTTRDRFAAEYQHEGLFDKAHQILDEGLARFPDRGMLWLRKGRVHWYQDHYSLAYAALTTALKYGSPRQAVLYNSAQVLTEWGSFETALVESKKFLTGKRLTSDEGSAVRSARAYIWGLTGELPRALKEFAAIEKVQPDTAWVYYRRALCHHTSGDTEAATADLARALTTDESELMPGQRYRALELLKTYNVAPPSEIGIKPFERRKARLNL